MPEPTRRFTLRDLPFVARLTLALFLCSVGLGYFAALVQLHTQQAKAGQLLPREDEVVAAYHGKSGVSTLERLLTADENLPLSSNGSMRSAFTHNSSGWSTVAERRAKAAFVKTLPEGLDNQAKNDKWEDLPKEEKDKLIAPAKKEIPLERETELAALLDWVRHDLDRQSYKEDKYILPDDLKDKPLTERYKTKKAGKAAIKIDLLIRERCVRCHSESGEAADAPLDDWSELAAYGKPNGSTAMPLRKLAQSTHVHLLGFSMLYMLTGFIFAMSGWPAIFRFFIAPLALLAQMVDIGFWWLARLQDPYGTEFAKCIIYSGGVAGAALGMQIILSLFSLFGWFGRFVLFLLILAALAGGYFLNDLVITPYLASETAKLSP